MVAEWRLSDALANHRVVVQMLCDRCGHNEATGVIGRATLSPDGAQTSTSEYICSDCGRVERAASAARQDEVRARLADGSIFEEIRADLAGVVKNGDAGELARAAEFLDLVIANLDSPVPDDLREFADRYRAPAV